MVDHREMAVQAPAANRARNTHVAVAGLIPQMPSSEPIHISHAGMIHPVASASPMPASGQPRRIGSSSTQKASPRPQKTAIQIVRSNACRTFEGKGGTAGTLDKNSFSRSTYPICSR